MTAVGLIFGDLTAESYEDAFAANPLIDQMREKMVVEEEPLFSNDYLDPEKRSIANAVQVFFNDGSATEKIVVEYPLGHRRRRKEGLPLLIEKYNKHLNNRFSKDQASHIFDSTIHPEELMSMSVNEFVSLWIPNSN